MEFVNRCKTEGGNPFDCASTQRSSFAYTWTIIICITIDFYNTLKTVKGTDRCRSDPWQGDQASPNSIEHQESFVIPKTFQFFLTDPCFTKKS